MADAKYSTREYREARTRYRTLIESGQGWCAQPVCVMADRWIPPGADFDTAHDDSGTVILGPAHTKCNRSDGGKRRWRAKVTRWVL